MEIKKTELTPTLKIEATNEGDISFTKPFQATIRDVKEVDTMHGKRVILNLEREVSKEAKEIKMSVFLNAKSKNMLIDSFGTETDKWIGQIVDLKKETDEKFKKEMIVLYPLKK